MEYPQVNGHFGGWESAHCKTVGSAYVGSNPTPATTCENGPLAAETRPGGPFSSCHAVYQGVSLRVDAWQCARTYGVQRPGETSGAYNRLLCYLVAVGNGKDAIGRREAGGPPVHRCSARERQIAPAVCPRGPGTTAPDSHALSLLGCSNTGAVWLPGCGRRSAVSLQVPRMYFPYTFHIPPMDLLAQQAVTASESYWPPRARSSCRVAPACCRPTGSCCNPATLHLRVRGRGLVPGGAQSCLGAGTHILTPRRRRYRRSKRCQGHRIQPAGPGGRRPRLSLIPG